METNATLHSGSVKSQPNQADSLHLHFCSPNSVCLVNRDTRTQARYSGVEARLRVIAATKISVEKSIRRGLIFLYQKKLDFLITMKACLFVG